jgi:peptidoglycan/LPS O-acetylase OafA/YrhL
MGRDLPPDDRADHVVGSGRRSDLDALRAVAMLLGLVLHAALAYSSLPWPVRDVEPSSSRPFDVIFFVIHGFRMPLFFLLSGFFAWMLLEQRGLRGFVPHRLRRIVLPLLVGAVTVVPLMDAAAGWAGRLDVPARLLAAAYEGDDATVGRLLAEGAYPDGDPYGQPPSGAFGESPLHAAALMDHVDVARLLVAAGASTNQGDANRVEVMGWAIAAGSEGVAEVLVDAGLNDPRQSGQGWADLPGWGDLAAIESSEGDAQTFSLHHLWFLWFLAIFTVGSVAVVGVVSVSRRVGARRFSFVQRSEREWERWHRLAWALIPLTLVPQLMMGDGGRVRTFGPGASTGLLPAVHHLAYFAIFFAFGAFLSTRRPGDDRRRIDAFARHWIVLIVLAIGIAPLGLSITFGGGDWTVASFLQIAFVWLVIPGSIGLFRAVFAEEVRGVRFLADASYWIYLTHLPVQIWLQAVLVRWDVGPWLKFVVVIVMSMALGLATYRAFVRYSPIGWVLNGPRPRPSREREPDDTVDTPASGRPRLEGLP